MPSPLSLSQVREKKKKKPLAMATGLPAIRQGHLYRLQQRSLLHKKKQRGIRLVPQALPAPASLPNMTTMLDS